MPSLVDYALRREEADRLAEEINRVLVQRQDAELVAHRPGEGVPGVCWAASQIESVAASTFIVSAPEGAARTGLGPKSSNRTAPALQPNEMVIR
jgi:hypothetical protein